MTLGKKIKDARKKYGLSQEQLAEKLSVSRSAVAKWEADNGMPDVDNLKALSQLFGVSLDYLLADDITDKIVMRENHNLALYKKGSKNKKKEQIIRERFPNADIYPLWGEQKLTKGEKLTDNLIGFFTDAPFGIPEFINSIKNASKAFFLVEEASSQFLVTVTDEFMEIRQSCTPLSGNKFETDNFIFRKCKHKLK